MIMSMKIMITKTAANEINNGNYNVADDGDGNITGDKNISVNNINNSNVNVTGTDSAAALGLLT